MRIKIIRTPSGLSPEEVRRGWVGIILEYTTKVKARPTTDLDLQIGRKNAAGYMVGGFTALEALKDHNPESYEWYKKDYPTKKSLENVVFIFTTDVCEKVPQ